MKVANISSISETSVRHIKSPIHVPFAISSETLNEASSVIIELKDEDGLCGIGEASPFPTLTGDNVEGVLPTVQEILDQIRPLNPLRGLQTLRAIRDEIFLSSPSAYVGVETALWDIYAKQLGVPLAAIWGGRMIDRVITDITLPIMPAGMVQNFWGLFAHHGFEVIKIKVSGHVSDDLDMIHAMIDLLPRNALFTLDGNQGYRLDHARALLSHLAAHELRPLFFEQPLPSDDWSGLKQLEDSTGTPVCLDESVTSPEDAIRVVREKTASMINLKIMKSGIEETMRIITIARASGIALMIGGMLESEIAMSASLQLACGVGGIQHFDLDTPFFFKTMLTKDSPWHKATAELVRPEGPGLGLELIT